MAIIDYHSIKSLTYAKLKPCSRILIPVLSCLCDDWDGSLSPEHSKHHILAMYSGLSISSIQAALQELREKDIISTLTQRGKPASIQYIPATILSAKSEKHRQRLPISYQKVGNGYRPNPPKIPPQTPAPTGEKENGKNLALNDSPKIKEQQPTDVAFLNNQFLNKQDPKIVLLAELIGHALVKQKMAQKGSAFVVDLLKAISGRKGEIDDPAAYFVSCCTKDIIPWTRKQKAKSLAKEKRQQRELYEEANAQRWERHTHSVITDQDNPEVQARIKVHQQNLWAILGEPEVVHNPPA